VSLRRGRGNGLLVIDMETWTTGFGGGLIGFDRQRRKLLLWVNSFMQSLLQRVSFYLHCSLDTNKDKMIPSAAVTA